MPTAVPAGSPVPNCLDVICVQSSVGGDLRLGDLCGGDVLAGDRIGVHNLRDVTGDGDPRADRPEVPQLFAVVLHDHVAAAGPQDERAADASRLSRFPPAHGLGVLSERHVCHSTRRASPRFITRLSRVEVCIQTARGPPGRGVHEPGPLATTQRR